MKKVISVGMATLDFHTIDFYSGLYPIGLVYQRPDVINNEFTNSASASRWVLPNSTSCAL
jgi:hypothetical protein